MDNAASKAVHAAQARHYLHVPKRGANLVNPYSLVHAIVDAFRDPPGWFNTLAPVLTTAKFYGGLTILALCAVRTIDSTLVEVLPPGPDPKTRHLTRSG